MLTWHSWFLSPPLEWWGHRHVPPHLVYCGPGEGTQSCAHARPVFCLLTATSLAKMLFGNFCLFDFFKKYCLWLVWYPFKFFLLVGECVMWVCECGHMCGGQGAIQGVSVWLHPACPLTWHCHDTLRPGACLEPGPWPTGVDFTH